MSNLLIATLLTAVSVSGLLPEPPKGEFLVLHPKLPSAVIFEWSDYGGTASTARARVTKATVRENCEAFIDPAKVAECGDLEPDPKVYTVTANCQTGEFWSVDGHKYLFDGRVDSPNPWDNGVVAMKDAVTGKRVATNNTAGGLVLGAHWLVLCPLGMPYDLLPAKSVMPRNEYSSGMGTFAGHNGSGMYVDQGYHTIIYSDPKPSLARSIRPETVLFRGWIIWGGQIRGVAYTFKKGCPPAPYLVSGNNDDIMRFIVEGAAPVRKGCKVVGYTKKSGNAHLVIDLPPE